VSISAISASGAVPAYAPVSSTNLYATLTPSFNAALTQQINPPIATPITDPASTSRTIAQTYGFAPSLIVPLSLPLIYRALNPSPDAVTGVAPVSIIPRAGAYSGYLFDSVA
jgi:hypothetical protein